MTLKMKALQSSLIWNCLPSDTVEHPRRLGIFKKFAVFLSVKIQPVVWVMTISSLPGRWRWHSIVKWMTTIYRCPKKNVPFSKIFLWAPDVILESFIYQKLGNKSKFFSTLQRFNMGRLTSNCRRKLRWTVITDVVFFGHGVYEMIKFYFCSVLCGKVYRTNTYQNEKRLMTYGLHPEYKTSQQFNEQF